MEGLDTSSNWNKMFACQKQRETGERKVSSFDKLISYLTEVVTFCFVVASAC